MKGKLTIKVLGNENNLTALFLQPVEEENQDYFQECLDDGDLYDFIFNGGYKSYFFAAPYTGKVELTLTDENGKEIAKTVLEDGICPTRPLQNLKEIHSDLDDDDPQEAKERADYVKDMKFMSPISIDNESIKEAWKDLISNDSGNRNFLSSVFAKAMGCTEEAAIWLTNIDDDNNGLIEVAFDIEWEEEFDFEGIDYINPDQEFANEILNNCLGQDIVLLNVITYNGKMFFGTPKMEDSSDSSSEESGALYLSELESDLFGYEDED